MNPTDNDLTALPFSLAATAITVRIISVCPGLTFQPLDRPPIGIALFSVVPHADGLRFLAQTRALRDEALPIELIDWLEDRLPATGAVLTRDRDDLRHTLRGASDASRHVRIAALVNDTADRLQIVPNASLCHVPSLKALGMPCLCRRGEECAPRLPSCFLPDPDETEAGLIRLAAATWEHWAEQHAASVGQDHPVHAALHAFANHAAEPAVA